MNAITYITNRIARFVQIYSDLFNFKLAVESLAHRTLSTSLIGPRQTKSLLENITRSLEGTTKRLNCFTAPHQNYSSKEYQVVRNDKHILIRLKIPYSTAATIYGVRNQNA
jgi:hypothetical protein